VLLLVERKQVAQVVALLHKGVQVNQHLPAIAEAIAAWFMPRA